MKAIAATIVLASLPGSAGSYPPLEREPLLEAVLPAANPPVHMVRGARIAFAPGQPTGRHRHPISVAGVVTRGSFRFQVEGEAPRLLKRGDSFFEPAERIILQFDNASRSAPAEIVAFYLTDGKERPLIDAMDTGKR
jgi:quercetin dioxygenase-like cupin family protein